MILSFLEYYQNDLALTIQLLHSTTFRRDQEMTRFILDIFARNETKVPNSEDLASLLKDDIIKFLEDGEVELVDRFIKLLPKCTLEFLAPIIVRFSFPTVDTRNPNSIQLTQSQLNHLLSLSEPFELGGVVNCCLEIQKKCMQEVRLVWEANVKSNNQPGASTYSAQHLLNELYEHFQKMLIPILLKVVVRDKADITQSLLSLAYAGELLFLKVFYKRYGDLLALEDHFKIMTHFYPNTTNTQAAFEAFKGFFSKFNGEFSDGQKFTLNEYVNMLRGYNNLKEFRILVVEHIEISIPDLLKEK